MDTAKLGQVFGERVLKKLIRWLDKHEKEHEEIPQLRKACQDLAMQERSGFGAWAGEVIKPGDSEVLLSVARYLDNHPVSSSKIEVKAGQVLYENKDGKQTSFDPLEFLAQLSAVSYTHLTLPTKRIV